MCQVYAGWQDNKIITTVNTTGMPIRYVPFPAITICGLGSVAQVMSDRLYDQVTELVKQQNADDVSIQFFRPVILPGSTRVTTPTVMKASTTQLPGTQWWKSSVWRHKTFSRSTIPT